jgi:hypothetical protein
MQKNCFVNFLDWLFEMQLPNVSGSHYWDDLGVNHYIEFHLTFSVGRKFLNKFLAQDQIFWDFSLGRKF